ncbi:hypothetical protein [Commensalibacter sp. Nvir]
MPALPPKQPLSKPFAKNTGNFLGLTQHRRSGVATRCYQRFV